MANTKTKTKNRGGFFKLLGRFAVVCAAVYLGVSFVGGQMKVSAKQRELQELETNLQLLEEENAELQRILDSGDTAAYIEKVAREMGYARPEERLYVDITGQ